MPANPTITAAIAATHPNPSPAQRAAGNFRKGKIRLHGLLISIENPKGTKRRPEWKPLACHYGYINRTEGKDGDAVDVFIGPNPASELVFVIDQVTESGKRFDEHKCMFGCVSKKQAKRLYLANYQAGWKCGTITAMTVDQFKTWLAKGDTTQRVSEQVSRYDKSSAPQWQAGKVSRPDGPPASPAPAPAGPSSAVPGVTHQVGETKSVGGTTYRLNENSRWELADPDEEGQAGGVPGQQPPGADPSQQPPEPTPHPAVDPAARNSFTASRLSTVHPEIGGLMRAIHESPHFKASGEFASYDVHQKVAGDLHSTLAKHAGKEIAGGTVVDLGQGRFGFASEAGSIAIWPADETGRHQITYTNKTGIVGRAMAAGAEQKGGGDEEQEQPAETGGTDQPPVEAEPEAPPRVAKPIAPPPLPAPAQQQSGAGGNPFRQSEPPPTSAKSPANPRHLPENSPPPAGKLPDEHKAKLSRSFSAGNNRGSIEFENEQHRDLYDLGAKHSYVGRGGRNKTSDRHVGDIKALTAKLTEATGMSESELKGHAAEVFKHTKGQMKGLKDGEHRAAKMPTTKDTAPLADFADKNAGKGDVPTPTPEALEMGKLPMESQRAGSAAQTFLKTAGLAVTPENHKLIQHAIKSGWVKNKAELRAMLKTAKKIHEKGGTHNYQELKGIKDPKERGRRRAELASNDYHALKDAIRRKGNRERRESWAKIVKTQADAWDMTPQDYHETASKIYKEFAAPMLERENAKDSMRRLLAKGGKGVTRMIREAHERGGKQGKGGDYSSVNGFDKVSDYLERNHPHLVRDGNAELTAWNMLLEGRTPPPGKTSQEFTDHMGEFLQSGMGFGQAGGGDGEGGMSAEELAEIERQNAETSFGDDDESMADSIVSRRGRSAVPFSKIRAGAVIRYRKWRATLLN